VANVAVFVLSVPEARRAAGTLRAAMSPAVLDRPPFTARAS
jgi:hypothetical protein